MKTLAIAILAIAVMCSMCSQVSACGPSATVSFADAVAVPVVPTNAVFAADFGFRRLAFADVVAFQPVVAVRAPFVSVAIGRGGLGLRAVRFPLARAIVRRALFPRLPRLGL